MTVPVASIDDVLVEKLLALTGHEPDFQEVLAIGRALREQIDWGVVREAAAASPFARAFFTLVEGLEIAPPSAEVVRLAEVGDERAAGDSTSRPLSASS